MALHQGRGAGAEKFSVLTKLTVVASDWEAGNVDVGAFIGVVLGVQGTLVALVYPLIFSFVSVFLQRRAKSEVALRIYTLSSGVARARWRCSRFWPSSISLRPS